jgi:aryl-alcohol dehydrogenase-like predicted oxidoreductase
MTEALWTADRSGLAPPACNRIVYSLANRAAEQEMLPACRRFGGGVLAGGLLAGPAMRQRPIAGGLRWGGGGFRARQVALAERLEVLAGESGQSPACWRSAGW